MGPFFLRTLSQNSRKILIRRLSPNLSQNFGQILTRGLGLTTWSELHLEVVHELVAYLLAANYLLSLQRSRTKIGEATTLFCTAEKRGRRHMGKQLKISAKSAQAKKREYANKYVNMKGRRVECRRMNAQDNYKPFKYGHHASSR